MKKMKKIDQKVVKLLKKWKWFTLVELIIVIAIIAILAVSAFLLLTKWIWKSRNSTRISDVNKVVQGIQVFYMAKWKYPTPDKAIKIKAKYGSTDYNQFGYQWKFTENTKAEWVEINKAPEDPLDQWENLSYTRIDFWAKGFEVWALLEKEKNSWYLNTKSVYADDVYATVTDKETRTPYVISLYNSWDLKSMNLPYLTVFQQWEWLPDSDELGTDGSITIRLDDKVVIDVTWSNVSSSIDTWAFMSASCQDDNSCLDTQVAPTSDTCTFGAGDASESGQRKYTFWWDGVDGCLFQ
mgnify:CR=1 FL=1